MAKTYQFLFTCLLFSPLSLALMSPTNGDDSLIQRAREEAQAFVFECEEIHETYLMKASIKVDSSPDAPILFSSTGSMALLRSGQFVMEEVSWVPDVLDEPISSDGFRRYFVLAFPCNTAFFTMNRTRYVVLGGDLEPVEKSKKFVGQEVCVDLFDWPFVSAALFEQVLNIRLPRHEFETPERCFHAVATKAGGVDSYWANLDSPREYSRCVFEEGLLVRYEVVYVGPDFKPKNEIPKPVRRMEICTVETVWQRFGAGSVPKQINAVMTRGSTKEDATYNVVAKIEVFGKDSKEFQERELVAAKLALKVPKNKATEEAVSR